MCVGDEIVFGFGVAKHRECDDVSSKNTVKKAEMCRPCSLPLRSTCPVSVCLCDTEHLGREAVVGLMLGTIRPVIVVVCGVVCGGRVAPVVLCMVD